MPEFSIFFFQNIPYEIDYYETCYSLLNILVYIYNKLYDNETTNVERIDKAIMDNIIDPIVEDVSQVADKLLNNGEV